jgi:manganese/zinc/iron transport system permease protein
MRMKHFSLLLLIFFLLLGTTQAARISEVVELSMVEQALRFFSFRDPAVRHALAGSLLLGLCCGLMGSFLVVRKLALMGDALAHAVLPGVALGFLWNMTKDPLVIFFGAVVSGLLGAGTVQLLRQTSKHREDASLGFVLASFYGAGICLLTMIQTQPGGNKAGLDKFMFGQAAAMGAGDVALLAGVALACLLTVALLFKEFRVVSFDPGFARAVGLPVRGLLSGLMLLLAFAIVASLQAVGVVLVTAMLVIPAATAYLLTDRLGIMLVLSAVLGMAAGGLGAFGSFVGRNLPTGPFMVLAGAAVFLLALAFGPRHGILARWWRHRCQAARVRRENTLKAVYHVLEDGGFAAEEARIDALAARRHLDAKEMRRLLGEVQKSGDVTVSGDAVAFTPQGRQRASEIVRNHRLWELYLTHAAQLPADHVHDDAEAVEHILGEETVRKLEKRLNYARLDPHGRLIPGLEDIHPGQAAERSRATGYGQGGEMKP